MAALARMFTKNPAAQHNSVSHRMKTFKQPLVSCLILRRLPPRRCKQRWSHGEWNEWWNGVESVVGTVDWLLNDRMGHNGGGQ
jgi:hypothetical protein